MAVCLLLNRASEFQTREDNKLLCDAFLREVFEKKAELLLSQMGAQATRLFFAKASTRLTYKAFQLMLGDPDFYLQSPICFEEVIFRMKRRKGDIQSDAECLKAANEATAFLERMLEGCVEAPSRTLLTGYLSRYLVASIKTPNEAIVNFLLDHWDSCASLSNVQRYLNEYRHQASMAGSQLDQELAFRVKERQQAHL